jgi:hypothetical protein
MLKSCMPGNEVKSSPERLNALCCGTRLNEVLLIHFRNHNIHTLQHIQTILYIHFSIFKPYYIYTSAYSNRTIHTLQHIQTIYTLQHIQTILYTHFSIFKPYYNTLQHIQTIMYIHFSIFKFSVVIEV